MWHTCSYDWLDNSVVNVRLNHFPCHLIQEDQRAGFHTAAIRKIERFLYLYVSYYRKISSQCLCFTVSGHREIKRIRTKLLQPLIVRRTRTDLRETDEYRNDLKQQGVAFPDIVPPRQVLYQLDAELEQLYESSFALIRDTANGLKYFRYQAIKYLRPEVKGNYKQADMILSGAYTWCGCYSRRRT